MTPRADVTVRLANPHDVGGIVDLESRYYVDNLDAAARAKGFISVLHSPACIDEAFRGCGIYASFNAITGEFYRDRYNIGVVFVAAANPRSLHTTTTKLGARSLAEFEVDSARYHFLAFAFGDGDPS